jgi:hypothetical protein
MQLVSKRNRESSPLKTVIGKDTPLKHSNQFHEEPTIEEKVTTSPVCRLDVDATVTTAGYALVNCTNS